MVAFDDGRHSDRASCYRSPFAVYSLFNNVATKICPSADTSMAERTKGASYDLCSTDSMCTQFSFMRACRRP